MPFGLADEKFGHLYSRSIDSGSACSGALLLGVNRRKKRNPIYRTENRHRWAGIAC